MAPAMHAARPNRHALKNAGQSRDASIDCSNEARHRPQIVAFPSEKYVVRIVSPHPYMGRRMLARHCACSVGLTSLNAVELKWRTGCGRFICTL